MSKPNAVRPHHHRRRRRAKAGASPGTLVADPNAPRPVLSLIAYSPSECVELRGVDLAKVRELRARFPVVWLDVAGLGDVDTIRAVGQLFGLHRLELEDVVNVHQRPKVERFPEHDFVVAQMIERGATLETEQLALFFGADFVLTFQERPGDGFGPVRERARTGQGVMRSAGADYLAYALLDAAVDQYFPPLEAVGERLEALEDEFCRRPNPAALQELYRCKRELLTLRRAAWPLREAIGALHREEAGFVRKETRPYLNDLYDHVVQIMELVETYRELSSSLLEVYLSSMSHRLNEVMRVLTVIATIFIPLTFLSSIWGMNFEHMPELKTRWGYPVALLAMLVVGLLFFWSFKRRGWIGSGGSSGEARTAEGKHDGPGPKA